METERDQGDIPCVAPVHFLPPRKPLVDEVPSSEQAAIQCNVGDPRETTDMSHKRLSHYCNVDARHHKYCVLPSGSRWETLIRLITDNVYMFLV